jgi:hypothetical protein
MDEVNYKELLRPDSQYLPSFAFSTKENWHSHVGYFVPVQQSSKRLVNINVDMIDLTETSSSGSINVPVQRRSAGIYSMAQDRVDPTVSPADFAGMTSILQELHTILKKVFSELITDEAQQRISLNAEVSP